MPPQDEKTTAHMDPKKSYVIKKEKMEIVVLTDHFRVEGVAHFIPQARISDFMNRTDIHFVPLTDATVYHRSTGEKIYSARFVCLNKEDVTVLVPKDEIS